jgi:hypothetical protein
MIESMDRDFLPRFGWAVFGLMTAGTVLFLLESPTAAVLVTLLALGSFYIAAKPDFS